MSMLGDIAREYTVQEFVIEIAKKLISYDGEPEAISVLKEMGRFALMQFEGGTPDWAEHYERLFRKEES